MPNPIRTAIAHETARAFSQLYLLALLILVLSIGGYAFCVKLERNDIRTATINQELKGSRP